MTKAVSGINSEVLKWARERARLSIEEVATSLKRDVAEILAWEAGEAAPTYGQLEKLAYKIYKRPVAIFFFPTPPEEPDPSSAFRTLPDFEIENLQPDTLYTIRRAAAMQISVSELCDGVNPNARRLFASISLDPTNPDEGAQAVRAYLGIPLSSQLQWKSTDEALKAWRSAVEAHGVFVFKSAIKQKDISGFALADVEFPVIYLNNSSAKTRQIFTLFHELAHVLLHSNGVTKTTDSYIEALEGSSKAIEIFCNRFTSEFLVPSSDFDTQLMARAQESDLDLLAERYKVSREVILRKLLHRGEVSRAYYEQKAQQWNEEYEKLKSERPPGGDYYATQATYLGEGFLRLAFRKYYEGRLTVEELADHLNVKPRSVAGLEEFMLRTATV